MIRLLFLINFCLLNAFVLAQGENNNWLFGNRAGVSFTGGTIRVLTAGAVNSNEGVSSISDSLGNLLFYTDGGTVYTRNHTIMPNGTSLGISSPSTQAALIVPLPGSNSIYYIFSLDVEGRSGGLQIATVDMTLNGGLGAITSKNDTLEKKSTEKISGIFHSNGTDIWVVTHGVNNDNFNAYLMTKSGLTRTPVVSKVGTVHNIGLNGLGAIGYMRFSHDGTRLALAIWQELFIVEIFDFDAATGIVSDPITLTKFTKGPNNGPYGLEFSPNGKFLYVSESNLGSPDSRIIQYDLELESVSIEGARQIIATSSSNFGTMLLAPNQKIYVTLNGASALGEISAPNIRGTAAGFKTNTVNLVSGIVGYGLPNFLRGFVSTVEFDSICVGDSTVFSVESSIEVADATWEFGDGTMGTGMPIKHRYPRADTFDLKVDVSYANGASQTLETEVVIEEVNAFFDPIPTICIGPGAVPLVTGRPAGGRYSGPGVDSDLSTFTPTRVGAGTFNLQYVFKNSSGCIDTAYQSVTTISVSTPTITVSKTDSSCLEDPVKTLSRGSPAGGIYEGPGVIGGTNFSPRLAGFGTHKLNYAIFSGICTTRVEFEEIVLKPVSANLALRGKVCVDSDTFRVSRAVSSGTFSGVGIDPTGLFNPARAGVGSHEIYHQYNDLNGCISRDTGNIEVLAPITATLAAVDTVCISAASISLVGNPGGGTFSGPGVLSTSFVPGLARAGTHRVRYIVGRPPECTDTAFQTIVVEPLPRITNFPFPNICINDDTIKNLNFFAPPGGTYILNGADITEIVPSSLRPSTFGLYYRYQDPVTKCEATVNTTFSVFGLEALSRIKDTLFTCIGQDSILLDGISPKGGVYRGVGVFQDTLFNTLAAGIGKHNLTYEFVNSNKCKSSINYFVNVLDTPSVVFNPIPDVCPKDPNVNLINFIRPRRAGGNFSGKGVNAAGILEVKTAGIGEHFIQYRYADARGCSVKTDQTVKILDTVKVKVKTLGNFCIDSDSVLLFGEEPKGGTYSGRGYNSLTNHFNPRVAGVGTHTLTYEFTDAGCISSNRQSIEVFGLPSIFLPDTVKSCADTPITLNAFHPTHTSSTTYLWSTGATTSTITVSNVGTLEVWCRVTNTIGPNSCSRADTTVAQILPVPFVDIPAKKITVCFPDSVIVDVFHESHRGQPIRYLWSDGTKSSRIVIKNIGNFDYTVSVEDTIRGCKSTDKITVKIGSLPIVNLKDTLITCQSDGGVILDASNPTLVSGAKYRWNTGETTSRIRLNYVGKRDLIVQVTEPIANCISFDTIHVNILSTPTITLSDTIDICTSNLPATIDAKHPTHRNVRYEWSTGAKNSAVTLNFAGRFDYFLKITDTLSNCSVEKRIHLRVLPPPVADLGKDKKVCASGEITLDATLSSHAGRGFSYVWSTGATTPQIKVNTIGNYKVRVFDPKTSCEATDDLNLLFHPHVAVSLGKDKKACLGNDVIKLDAFNALHRGQNVLYRWSTGATTPQVQVKVDKSTEVWVSVFNPETFCQDTDTIKLNFEAEPVLSLKDTILCRQQELTINAFNTSHASRPITYLWNTGETTSNITVKDFSASNIFTVTARDTETGCFQSANMTVNLFMEPFLELGKDTVLCQTPLTLNAYHASQGNAYKYLWNTGNTTRQITVNSVGEHLYTVQISNQTTGCVYRDSIKITMLDKPISNFAEQNFCQNDIPALVFGRDESHPKRLKYLWKDLNDRILSRSDTLSVSEAGTYVLEISNNPNGCIAYDTLKANIIESPSIEIVNFSNSERQTLPITIGLASSNVSGLNLEWSFRGKVLDAFNNKLRLEVKQYGTYHLKATNPVSGCESVDSLLVFSSTPSCTFPNAFSPNGDTENDYFSPVIKDLKALKIKVFDQAGTEVFTIDLDTEDNWTGEFPEKLGWTGKDQTGLVLKEGKYFFRAEYSWLDRFNELNRKTKEGSVYLIR